MQDIKTGKGEKRINFPDWFHYSQLMALGIKPEYIYYLLVFLGMVLLYLLIHPLIQWFVAKSSTKLLSYLLSSLLLLTTGLLAAALSGTFSASLRSLLGITLETLAGFGVALILFYGVRRLVK
ncbi:hypothetical protein [Lentibacillus sediminis]|uniref:hypothetical protein n=1 Tax=Lentibacillus sediminis TaxID=1940529 RepID=UPI000C1C01D6|nr:hypothetical protein [Lentibacillus sediminis]